jgi:outer membrane protein assembly factor BamA
VARAEPAKAQGESPPDDHGFGVAPVAGATYSGETSVMFGAAAIFFYKHAEAAQRRDSRLIVATAYSIRNQFTIFADGSLYLADDALRISARTQFSIFPDSYFGIGNDTKLADEERYTPVIERFELSPQYQLLDGLYAGPSLSFEHQRITDVAPGGMLDTQPIPGRDGGTALGIGVELVYDSRDSTLYPERGTLLQMRSLVSDPLWGSDFRRSRTRFDLRAYFPMPPTGHVLAIRSLTDLGTGTHPFWDMPRLGGANLLRGQFAGRYRDQQAVALQTEYRLPLFWRFGMVGFTEVGQVAPELTELTIKGIRYSVGGGLRFNLSNKAPMNFRVDVGGGRDDWDVYVNVGEVF